jgi:hypothetical protein
MRISAEQRSGGPRTAAAHAEVLRVTSEHNAALRALLTVAQRTRLDSNVTRGNTLLRAWLDSTRAARKGAEGERESGGVQ